MRACTFRGPMHRDCDFCLWNRSVLLHCLQVGLDQLDQNAAVNEAGAIVGKYAAPKTKLTDTALQPYSEVFGLQRFRETELIHGRRV